MPQYNDLSEEIYLTKEEQEAFITLIACGTYKKNCLSNDSSAEIGIKNRISKAQEIVTKILEDCPVGRS